MICMLMTWTPLRYQKARYSKVIGRQLEDDMIPYVLAYILIHEMNILVACLRVAAYTYSCKDFSGLSQSGGLADITLTRTCHTPALVLTSRDGKSNC